MKTKDFKKTKGITLISLIVSIVVLLILAGVSIVTLTGDNGLLTRTEGAKNKTKLAEAQEIASLEYLNSKIGDYVNGTETNIAMSNVISALNRQGIETYTKIAEGTIITGAILLDGNSEVESQLRLGFGDSKTLTISTITSNENGNSDYYVIIDGLYYKIIPKTKGLDILKDGVTLESINSENNNTQSITISVTGLDDSTTVQKIVVSEDTITYQEITDETTFENGDTIKITAGESSLTGAKINVEVIGVTEQYEVGLTVSQPKACYYGTKVTTGVTSVNGVAIEDNWKIFYADEDNVYLIYGDFYPINVQVSVGSGRTDIISFPGLKKDNFGRRTSWSYAVIAQDVSSMLKYLKNNATYNYSNYITNKNYDDIEPASNEENRYQSWNNLLTAYLNNGNILAQKATKVQGSPNIEMWVKSWNEKYNDVDGKVAKLKTLILGESDYGYKIGDSNTAPKGDITAGGGNSENKTGMYDTLYYPYINDQDYAHGYWLASPGGGSIGNELCGSNIGSVNIWTISTNVNVTYPSRCCRPIVTIPRVDFNNNNVEGIIIEQN